MAHLKMVALAVHSSRDIFEATHFIFVHKSTFCPLETNAYRNCIFFKPLFRVVYPLHTNLGKQ